MFTCSFVVSHSEELHSRDGRGNALRREPDLHPAALVTQTGHEHLCKRSHMCVASALLGTMKQKSMGKRKKKHVYSNQVKKVIGEISFSP